MGVLLLGQSLLWKEAERQFLHACAPVAQKVQPIWQPTCEETHSVDRCCPSTACPSSLSSSPPPATTAAIQDIDPLCARAAGTSSGLEIKAKAGGFCSVPCQASSGVHGTCGRCILSKEEVMGGLYVVLADQWATQRLLTGVHNALTCRILPVPELS